MGNTVGEKMNRFAKKLILPAVLAAGMFTAAPAMAETTTFTGTMNIYSTITFVANNSVMTFPNTGIPAAGSTVVTLLPADAGALDFDVTATAGTTLTATMPASFLLWDGTATESVTVNNFTFGGANVTDMGGSGDISMVAGTENLLIGGDVTVPNTLTISGVYSTVAAETLTVVYQ